MKKFIVAITIALLATSTLAHNRRDPWPPMTTTTTPCSGPTTTTTLEEVCISADDIGECAEVPEIPSSAVSCHVRKDGSLRCPRKGTAHRILIFNTDSRFPQD